MSSLAIGRGLLGGLGHTVREAGLNGRVFLVGDDRVYPLFGDRAVEGLRSSGFDVTSTIVPSGEPTKSMPFAEKLYDWLIENRAERGDTIVALGGGMVGDLVGFVAATFLRGVPLVQIPTTVLSQIDSSIGGKVAVNHRKGKNLIGAFYPARLIVADVDTLGSLPPRELASGWAEAIKCAMILDAPLLDVLFENAAGFCDPTSALFQSDLLVQVVERCARHKVVVVEEDEREANLRMILNYGHTIGQGLEAALNYEVLLHGEAVSIGMTAAAWLSVERGRLSWAEAQRQRAVLERFGLPTEFPQGVMAPSVDAVLENLARDKKALGSRLRWVLLDRIGHAVIDGNVPIDLVRAAIDRSLVPELVK